MAVERLQKIIAKAGFASRREAETMIREGRVTINGRVVSELGTKADGAKDHIKVDGKLITRPETHRYILLYKPREIMTTVEDPEGRKTVVDLIKGVKERIFPVGRLDFQSEGLIILTNDGDLAYRVAHPSQGSVKTYHVKVRGVPEDRIIEKLQKGITLEGQKTRPCEIVRIKTTGRSDDEGNSWFDVRLREGRTQQIRKMFKAVGHPVAKLKRVGIGPITDASLQPGQWRELTRGEVKLLMSTDKQPPTRKVRKPPLPKTTASKRKTTAQGSRKGMAAKGSSKKGTTKKSSSSAAPRRQRSR
jgi:23S rRNA pseudouridine2605 synthase